MGFAITYKTVLEVNLWQHFLLDTASDNFSLPPSPATPAGVVQRMLQYDLRNILSLQPTAFSADQLRQRGLIFKPTTTGFFVVSKDGYTESEDQYRLSIAASLVDPAWLDYTDIGVTSLEGQVFHLTNFGLTPATRTLLTANGNESLRAEHFVPWQGRVVRLPQQVPGTATTIEVFDALSASVTPVLTVTLPAITGQTEYELDCRALREGLYRFSGANITTTTLYLGLENHPDLIGVIDLFVKDWEESVFDVRLAKN